MKKITLLSCFLCFAGMTGAGGTTTGGIPPTPPMPTTAGTDTAQKNVSSPRYNYSADRFTDPFVPYKAEEAGPFRPEFDPAGTQVGGLISTATGKIAVLRTASGSAYIVKGGRLIDVAGRTVAGYYARIAGNSVVVWTANGAKRYAYPMKTSHEGVSP